MMDEYIHTAEGELKSADPYVVGAYVSYIPNPNWRGVIKSIGTPSWEPYLVHWTHVRNEGNPHDSKQKKENLKIIPPF